jgi:hypothetical protein
MLSNGSVILYSQVEALSWPDAAGISSYCSSLCGGDFLPSVMQLAVDERRTRYGLYKYVSLDLIFSIAGYSRWRGLGRMLLAPAPAG